MTRIPFQIDDQHGHRISGLVFLEDEFVVFEIRVKKWGLYEKPTETVKAERSVISHMHFEHGFFNDRLFMVPKRSELLEAIPGNHKGELKLKVAKRYRNEVKRFVDAFARKSRTS